MSWYTGISVEIVFSLKYNMKWFLLKFWRENISYLRIQMKTDAFFKNPRDVPSSLSEVREYSIKLWPQHVDLVADDSGSLIIANVWQLLCFLYREQPISVLPGLQLGNNRRIQ